MKYLVISDIHANAEALDATLAAAGRVEHILVLGDLVGYGADPNAVIDRVRAFPAATIIRGNHDKVGAGLDSVDGFNYLARFAIEWTRAALSPRNRAWLAALPAGPMSVGSLVEICHGAPFDEDVYIFDNLDATRGLSASHHPLCLFGHTHVPAAFRFDAELQTVPLPRADRYTLSLGPDGKYLVNCGAVGQPRDGDPRAAFGLLDTEARELTLMRTPYDVATAQGKIIAAGLPEMLAQRLAVGH